MHNIFNLFQDTDVQQARIVNNYKDFFRYS